MKARIHRGARQIGGSCIEICSGNQSILLDAGKALNSINAPELPLTLGNVDFSFLIGIVISHPHLDHYGLLPCLPSVPVAMGAAARRILESAAPFLKQPPPPPGPTLIDGERIDMGPFTITPYAVDHSAYDAYALLIEADGRRIFYSGDFRLHGRKRGVMERFLVRAPRDIDVLLMEGTTLGRATASRDIISESELEHHFSSVFQQTRGLTMVQVSAQNIDRVVTIYRACLEARRTLVFDLYTAIILAATGNPRIPQAHWQNVALCIPFKQRIQIIQNTWFKKLEAHSSNRIFLKHDLAPQPGKFVLLFRNLWQQELEKANCLEDASFIYSMWPGYRSRGEYRSTQDWLNRHQIPTQVIHTSGHASPNDLKQFSRAISPRVLVPVHTDQPEAYNEFGISVQRHKDGEWWQV